METHYSFIQSSAWERLQQVLGRRTWRIRGALVIQQSLPFGYFYLYAPRPDLVGIEKDFFREIEKNAVAAGALFVKIDPARTPAFFPPQYHRVRALQPEETAIIDLAKTEGELFSAIHRKSRSRIRIAEENDVSVRVVVDPAASDIKAFLILLHGTAERKEFGLHPDSYYQTLARARDQDFVNEFFFAERHGTLLAAAMVNWYRPAGVATYLHSASNYDGRRFMAPHALQWHIIKEAKHRGFQYYDLWGIDERRWPGVTEFKLRLGGMRHAYPPSYETPIRPFGYWAFRAAKYVRSFFRYA